MCPLHSFITEANDEEDVHVYLLVSVLLALAPPPALREPLEEEEPKESDDELLMLSLSWPRPQEAAAQPLRIGRRLRVGELSEVVSGALLSMLAMPAEKHQHLYNLCLVFLLFLLSVGRKNTTYTYETGQTEVSI